MGHCAGIPLPLPAHRTVRAGFPHTALRLDSCRGFRFRAKMDVAQTQNPKFSEHAFGRELCTASSRHLVPPCEEVARAVIDVVVDRPIGLQPAAVVEVRRPSPQLAVQAIAYLRPCTHVAGHEHLAHAVFQTLHAFPRRARAQIPGAVLAEAMWKSGNRVDYGFRMGLPDAFDMGLAARRDRVRRRLLPPNQTALARSRLCRPLEDQVGEQCSNDQ